MKQALRDLAWRCLYRWSLLMSAVIGVAIALQLGFWIYRIRLLTSLE